MDEQETPVVPTWSADSPEPPAYPAEAAARPRRSRRKAGAAIVGSLLVGGAAGAALFGPLTATAASPAASPSTPANVDRHGGHGGFGGGPNETVTDTSVVAKAIGISEADLITALQSGQTAAQVAKAHNVDVQKVIDALVADGLSELAEQVKAGTITQAQADAQKAAVTQRATDQVNGTFMGGRGDGPGGHGGFGGGQPAPSANP